MATTAKGKATSKAAGKAVKKGPAIPAGYAGVTPYAKRARKEIKRHGYFRTSATTTGGDDAVWWERATLAFRREAGSWKVVHEHTSVPFYMDGSFRAAVDLEP